MAVGRQRAERKTASERRKGPVLTGVREATARVGSRGAEGKKREETGATPVRRSRPVEGAERDPAKAAVACALPDGEKNADRGNAREGG
jgi:L,D-peptidoglycan transpeptidase YkuD (ErfK/YbiS/YcfS/YnhG family)